ncbi:hypothetical protein [Enterovirga rhinocerotis]|uniref:Uncharacterized protein n=1 Tax=Enterovirga rhinocerotis TaxID=1339210 RepID=A0A4R7BNM7_9HYPH|nr:hypothetical protein [Enterovirga rhinocerotis]TDR87140.1 hypothetical protein EV668_4220 [Enterovirga rhinocerotis]
MADTVLRFVTRETHPPYGFRTGVFQTAYGLRDEISPADPVGKALHVELTWFEKNMATPTRFSVSRHPRAAETAISWIKASAFEHVGRLRSLATLVERARQVQLDELRTERPGYVVFEDDHQIVALPFSDTPR